MNDFTEQHNQFLALQEKLEKGFARKLARQINGFARKVARAYVNNSLDINQLSLEELLRLESIIGAQYRKVIPEFGKLAITNIKSREIKQDETLFELLVLQWIEERGLEQASLINTTTTEQINGFIQEGVREGEGARQIGVRIRQGMAGLSVQRALTIAQTETHNAATFGSLSSTTDAANRFNMRLLKFWVPTLDERTRVSHGIMSSHPGIPLDEKFTVGGTKMDRPGDPAGGAANVIKCRCTLVYREEEFEIE